MADIAAKVLQLSPEQHEMLGHAIALAHAVHASIGNEVSAGKPILSIES